MNKEILKLKWHLLFLITIGLCPVLNAQEKTPAKDSIQVYKKIEQYSKRSKVTEQLHKWLFRPARNKPKKPTEKQKPTNFAPYAGKIIRNIAIQTKDPFGFSFVDSTEVANSWLEKTGNTIHIKSKEPAIRNYLLLKENEPLDTLLLMESVRLLRAQNYIRQVSIIPEITSNSKDSVDLTIIALDAWSLIPKASFTGTQTKLGLRQRNFFGMGHGLKLAFKKRIDDGSSAVEAIYNVPNFKNTYISATGRYAEDYDGYSEKTIAVDRIFYSPLTRWAGGLFLGERYLGRSLPDSTVELTGQNLEFIAQDYWLGHSFKIFKGTSERERTTNLIISARTLLVDYKKAAAPSADSIRFFGDEELYLGSIGIASRQFIEDNYIFKDGIPEDVPVGLVYAITGGIQHKNQRHRLYLGGRAAYGNYFKWGFLSLDFEVGSFFIGKINEQTAFRFQANYFSHLWQLGDKWKLRQFIKPQLVIGINRLNSVADRLGFNENPEFSGFHGNLYSQTEHANLNGFRSHIWGTKKYLLELQTQFYSPWEVLGFHFNPYLHIGLAVLDGETNFQGNGFYPSFGIGCVIRNDFLVFNSFQFSLTFFPEIPGQGRNILKTNVFENDDFGFQDFQIGKPQTVIYN